MVVTTGCRTHPPNPCDVLHFMENSLYQHIDSVALLTPASGKWVASALSAEECTQDKTIDTIAYSWQ